MATRSFQSPAPMLLIWGTASTPELTRSNATSTNTAADPAFLYMHIGLDIRRGAAAGAALPHSSSFAFSAAAAIKARPQWRFAFWPPPPPPATGPRRLLARALVPPTAQSQCTMRVAVVVTAAAPAHSLSIRTILL